MRESDAAPLVSVVVPHYADLAGLDLCLAALRAQSLPRERFEIVVADNGSPQGEAAVAAAIAGRARLAMAPERGAGPARNAAVAATRGRILAFTDADCRPEPDWLAEGIEALETFDFVGGRMVVLVEDREAMTAAEAFETVFAFDNEAYVRDKGFSVSANLFCPAALFAAVGGFRAGVSEDVEWCRRATAAGYRLGYAPRAVVGHPARRTWPELRAKWRRTNAESRRLMEERPGGRLRWFLRCLVLPASAVVHTPRTLFSPSLPGVRSRLGALGMLYRLRGWRFSDGLRLSVARRAPADGDRG
ncbi:MAG: glycosyltransferase [Caulobacteraceae bacterium]